jgi:hypothetical protein
VSASPPFSKLTECNNVSQATVRERRQLAHSWRRTPEGLNHPFWYEHPAVAIQGGPFPSYDWDLLLVSRTRRQQLFHKEGCRCTTEVFVHHPGPSDFEGLENEARQVEDKRHYANQIQVAVDAEFNRIFALAKAQNGFCCFAQGYHQVYHYCRLSRNTARTQGGAQVGQLIYPQAYDAVNQDSLRWICPTNFERASIVASRLIKPIVDHCIHRLGQLGVRVPPVLGAWGFPFDSHTFAGFKYLLRIVGAPRSDPPVPYTIEDISWRRFLASDFTVPDDYPWESSEYLAHLVKYQNNSCTDPPGSLPTPLVQCGPTIIHWEEIDHYSFAS